MLENVLLNGADSIANFRGRIPDYEIQEDGSIQLEFVDPEETDKKAYDTETHVSQQVTLKGYANAMELSVEDIEEGDVKLMPTSKYQNFMEQNIIGQAMSAGEMDTQKIKYLTMANLVTLFIFGIIGISMMT